MFRPSELKSAALTGVSWIDCKRHREADTDKICDSGQTQRLELGNSQDISNRCTCSEHQSLLSNLDCAHKLAAARLGSMYLATSFSSGREYCALETFADRSHLAYDRGAGNRTPLESDQPGVYSSLHESFTLTCRESCPELVDYPASEPGDKSTPADNHLSLDSSQERTAREISASIERRGGLQQLQLIREQQQREPPMEVPQEKCASKIYTFVPQHPENEDYTEDDDDDDDDGSETEDSAIVGQDVHETLSGFYAISDIGLFGAVYLAPNGSGFQKDLAPGPSLA